ncbi:Protein CBG18670 [Caenorhabditis briggsae]|uniref:Protein CBG18670 n=1 Tax=Caenorhabditis briggsae TaxID=6238 RepID=A8XTV3_CAEBR|nr:Protein CBG18670 [Caenorhabditis briggsae]CAP36079.2 Protein CBG18670 [Caenorhabditis briggsae]
MESSYFDTNYEDDENFKLMKLPDVALHDVIKFWSAVDVFWNNVHYGLKDMFIHLNEILNCSVLSIESDERTPDEALMMALEFLSWKNQTSIRKLEIGSFECDLKEILEAIEVTETLKITSEFEIHPGDFEFYSKSATIKNSWWIENLEPFKNCVEIELSESEISNQSIIDFYGEWTAGSYSNLRWLSVKSENLNEDLKLNGVPFLKDQKDLRTSIEKLIGDNIRAIYGSVMVSKKDGTPAFLRFYEKEGRFELLI